MNSYLTSKVDRSVTGLVAQQQCVGALQTPLADVAVVALSYFDHVGAATAVNCIFLIKINNSLNLANLAKPKLSYTNLN